MYQTPLNCFCKIFVHFPCVLPVTALFDTWRRDGGGNWSPNSTITGFLSTIQGFRMGWYCATPVFMQVTGYADDFQHVPGLDHASRKNMIYSNLLKFSPDITFNKPVIRFFSTMCRTKRFLVKKN